jgi:hypothetical protein
MAFAEPGSAEVEAEDGKADAPVGSVQDLHGVIDDFVVKGAAAKRVRVTDESCVAGTGSAVVEEGFEPACGTAQVYVSQRGPVSGCDRFRRSSNELHSTVHFTRFLRAACGSGFISDIELIRNNCWSLRCARDDS